MRDGYANIKDAGATELIAISGDTQLGASNTRSDLGITFPLLSDSDFEAIEAYNVVNQKQPNFARPTAYIIDEDGKITWKDLRERYGQRTNSGQIITALQEL